MIAVDISALIAILDDEDDAAGFAESIVEPDRAPLSAATLVESGIVMLNRYGLRCVANLHTLVQEAGMEVRSAPAGAGIGSPSRKAAPQVAAPRVSAGISGSAAV